MGCFFKVHYTSENVVEGKSAAKKALQQRLGLQQTDTPVVGIISRLTVQKGIHLIKHAIYRTLERNGQVYILLIDATLFDAYVSCHLSVILFFNTETHWLS